MCTFWYNPLSVFHKFQSFDCLKQAALLKLDILCLLHQTRAQLTVNSDVLQKTVVRGPQ
jgi:hypothetical protein